MISLVLVLRSFRLHSRLQAGLKILPARGHTKFPIHLRRGYPPHHTTPPRPHPCAPPLVPDTAPVPFSAVTLAVSASRPAAADLVCPRSGTQSTTSRAAAAEARGTRTRMYGRRASQLLREIDSSEPGQLVPFNSDIFDQVIKECNEHNLQFQSLIRKMVDQNLDIETTRNEDHYGAAIHHLSLLRNKRCLMAYMYNRAEVIQSFRWKIGPVLPHDIQEKLQFSEKEYFKNHSAAIKSYISEMDIDLTVDMVPPKDPYIQVRVLEDIGEVSLGDHSVSLTKNSVHFLRRTDAEQFISQGLMEEFLE